MGKYTPIQIGKIKVISTRYVDESSPYTLVLVEEGRKRIQWEDTTLSKTPTQAKIKACVIAYMGNQERRTSSAPEITETIVDKKVSDM